MRATSLVLPAIFHNCNSLSVITRGLLKSPEIVLSRYLARRASSLANRWSISRIRCFFSRISLFRGQGAHPRMLAHSRMYHLVTVPFRMNGSPLAYSSASSLVVKIPIVVRGSSRLSRKAPAISTLPLACSSFDRAICANNFADLWP
jgi:hypothetical protein